MGVYEITSFRGALSDYEDKGIPGSFKFGANLDVRKRVDSLSAGQALLDEGLIASHSPSSSVSQSPSPTPSPSSSISSSPSSSPSPSSSLSASPSATTGISASISASPSASPSPSGSTSISSSPSPSPSPSSAQAYVFRDLIRWWVKASDGYTYGFGSGGYIYRRDHDANYIIVHKDPNGAIKGAMEWYSDSGQIYLQWATDHVLKKKPLYGLANWNDVVEISTTLESVDWHTMRECGGDSIICNGQFLAMVGYDQSYTNEALDLIPGNIAKTLVERNGRTVVGTVRKSNPDVGINAAIDAEVPIAQIGSDGELYFANMIDTTPVKRLPGGGKCNPGGVCNLVEQANFFEWEQDALNWIDKQSVGNMALLAVYGADAGKGGIYTYGRKNHNHPLVLNLEYQFDADELGAVEVVDGTVIFSYRDGSDFGVKAVDPNNKAIGIYNGLDFKSPVKKPVNITPYKYVETFSAPLVDGMAIECWYKVNKTGDFIRARMDGDIPQFTTVGEQKSTFLIGSEGEIYEPQVIIYPVGNQSPEIYRIRTYFD